MKNNDFGHKWGDLPIIFMSDAVTSENLWRITIQVTKSLLFMAPHTLLYFVHAFVAQREINKSYHWSIAVPLSFIRD